MATLGGLLFGYDTAVISGTVESLRKFFIEPFGLPLDQANALEGFVVSSALIGCILGASFAGWISQRYGRKPTLVLAAILFCCRQSVRHGRNCLSGCLVAEITHSCIFLCFYRIVGGVGVWFGFYGFSDVYCRDGTGGKTGEIWCRGTSLRLFSVCLSSIL